MELKIPTHFVTGTEELIGGKKNDMLEKEADTLPIFCRRG